MLTQIISTSCVNYRLVNMMFIFDYIHLGNTLIRLSHFYLFYTNIGVRNQFDNMLYIVTYYYILLLSNSIELFYTVTSWCKNDNPPGSCSYYMSNNNYCYEFSIYSYNRHNNIKEAIWTKHYPLKIQNSNLILQNILLSSMIGTYIL